MMSPKVRTTAAPTFSTNDPDFASIELLLTMEGVDGETTFTDLSSNAYTMTPSGVTTSNTYSKFGSTSADIAGAIDNQITTPSGVLDDTMSWTIECWVRITAPAYGGSSRTDPFHCIAYEYKGGGNSDQGIYINSSGVLAFFRGVGHTDATSSTSCSSGSNTVAFDEWQHVAICFDQADQEMYMFIQGNKVADARPIADGGWFASTNVFNIGNWSHPSYSVWRSTMNGYMEQFRVTSVCRYKNSFHVPIYPFPTTADPDFANVILLLPFDGTDGDTTTTDLSNDARTVTFGASAELDDAQSKFGSTSLIILDSTNDILSVPNSTDFVPDVDFTMEAHIRFFTDAADTQTILGYRTSGAQHGWILFKDPTSDQLRFLGYGSGDATPKIDITGSTSMVIDTWYHAAAVRSGSGDWEIFLDGVSEASGTESAGITNTGNPFYVGRDITNEARYLDGWADNVRITRGVARYTTGFTPPTAAYPTS